MNISIKLVYQYMVIFFKFSTTSNHLHPLQVENCDSNSRLVVDEDDNVKSGLKGLMVDILPRVCWDSSRIQHTFLSITSVFCWHQNKPVLIGWLHIVFYLSLKMASNEYFLSLLSDLSWPAYYLCFPAWPADSLLFSGSQLTVIPVQEDCKYINLYYHC